MSALVYTVTRRQIQHNLTIWFRTKKKALHAILSLQFQPVMRHNHDNIQAVQTTQHHHMFYHEVFYMYM